MRKYLKTIIMALAAFLPSALYAQNIHNLTAQTEIDSVYVFGFDLHESRSAKGGIWNLKTSRPETPLNYSRMQKDTVGGCPVVRLYREVALGNHPLNGWETWELHDGVWTRKDEDDHPVQE